MALTAVLLFRTLRVAHTAGPAETFVAGLIGLAVPRGRPLCQMDLRLRRRCQLHGRKSASAWSHAILGGMTTHPAAPSYTGRTYAVGPTCGTMSL